MRGFDRDTLFLFFFSSCSLLLSGGWAGCCVGYFGDCFVMEVQVEKNTVMMGFFARVGRKMKEVKMVADWCRLRVVLLRQRSEKDIGRGTFTTSVDPTTNLKEHTEADELQPSSPACQKRTSTKETATLVD